MDRPGNDLGDRGAPRLHRFGEIAAQASSLQPADPNVRRGLYAGVAITVVLGAGLAVAGALGEWPDVNWTFSPGWITAGVGCMALYLVAAAELWRRLLTALGPKLRPARATMIWFASALGRYVPTGLLLPVMRMAMSERQGVAKRICLVSVIYELALTLTAALLVGAYVVIALPDLSNQPARFAILALPALAMICLHPRTFHRATDYALTRLGRDRLPVSLGLPQLLGFVAVYSLTLLIAGASTYGLAKCIFPTLTASDTVIVFGSFAVATALSLIGFILPGGLGVREVGMALALSPAMPAVPAIAVAILSRVVQISLEVGVTLVTQLVRRRGLSASGQRR